MKELLKVNNSLCVRDASSLLMVWKLNYKKLSRDPEFLLNFLYLVKTLLLTVA